jgi:hypothetical protein
MKTYNLDTISKEKRTVFVLTYMGMDYFSKWSAEVRTTTDLQFIIVDNGSQTIPESLTKYPIFQTSQNVGCAGGWNVISNIAFNVYGMDKIIIAQDDAMFNISMLNDIWEHSTDDVIAGAYNRSFEFSLFGLTKVFWNTVGMFDENFIYVTGEDDDYKHRAKLYNKKVISLNYSADMNRSLTSRHITEVAKPANIYNLEYIKSKWGSKYELTCPFGDTSMSPKDLLIFDGLRDVYGNIDKFPSLYETENV